MLRSQGHRLTPQREVVLGAVERLGHATADDVHRAVGDTDPELNLSTVYRTLALLTDLGVIQQVNLADRTTVYHSKAVQAHVHLVCGRCGRVTDAEPGHFSALAGGLERTYGFDIDLERLVVSGTCRRCRAEERTT